MARGNISTYDAPREALRPDEQGFAAYEQMGRRVGGIYNQTAQDYKAIGQLQAQSIEGRKWPFDILALQQRSSDVSIKFGRDRSSGGGRAAHDDLGRMAAGMSALGGYLGATASDTGGGESIDVASGQKSIGRYPAGTGAQGLWAPPPPPGPTDDTPLLDPYKTNPGSNPDAADPDVRRMIDQTIAARPGANPDYGDGGGGFWGGVESAASSVGGFFGGLWESLTGGGGDTAPADSAAPAPTDNANGYWINSSPGYD